MILSQLSALLDAFWITNKGREKRPSLKGLDTSGMDLDGGAATTEEVAAWQIDPEHHRSYVRVTSSGSERDMVEGLGWNAVCMHLAIVNFAALMMFAWIAQPTTEVDRQARVIVSVVQLFISIFTYQYHVRAFLRWQQHDCRGAAWHLLRRLGFMIKPATVDAVLTTDNATADNLPAEPILQVSEIDDIYGRTPASRTSAIPYRKLLVNVKSQDRIAGENVRASTGKLAAVAMAQLGLAVSTLFAVGSKLPPGSLLAAIGSWALVSTTLAMVGTQLSACVSIEHAVRAFAETVRCKDMFNARVGKKKIDLPTYQVDHTVVVGSQYIVELLVLCPGYSSVLCQPWMALLEGLFGGPRDTWYIKADWAKTEALSKYPFYLTCRVTRAGTFDCLPENPA